MILRGHALLVAVALVGGSTGCEDRYGTYITFEAANQDLAFDRLELFYGVDIGHEVPTTPKHPLPLPEDTDQLLVARAFAPSDRQSFPAPQLAYTTWIPSGGQNDRLGTYVLAVAYAGTQRVAAGELFDFTITSENTVYLYTVKLDPVSDDVLYEWGRGGATCLRVERPRPDHEPVVVSIVDRDDSDCDLFPDRAMNGAADCEPLLYCDGSGGPGCAGRSPCLQSNNACSVGTCVNKDGASLACSDEVCVSDTLCETCDLTKPPAEILECALLENATHPIIDLPITTQGDQRLCNDPTIVDITLPFPCRAPRIEAVRYFMSSDPFEFAIEPGSSPNVCRLTIAATTDDRFRGVPHMLVTVEILAPRRTGFVLGLIAEGGACPPAGEPLVRQYAPNIGTCPVPDL